MDTPPDFQRLRRQTACGSARRLSAGASPLRQARRGRSPGAETRMTARSRGVDGPTILCLVRVAQATPLARGRMA